LLFFCFCCTFVLVVVVVAVAAAVLLDVYGVKKNNCVGWALRFAPQHQQQTATPTTAKKNKVLVLLVTREEELHLAPCNKTKNKKNTNNTRCLFGW
jgi:hypothetical protein